jgi:hypothetical protein
LAGDELTFTQIAAAISVAADRPVRYRQIRLAAFLDDDVEVWRADIAALRAMHPRLHTFDRWLRRNVDAFALR